MSTAQDSGLILRLIRGMLWAFSAKALALSTGLITTALLARMLSTEEMGSYFLIVSLTLFAGVLARFGMQQTVVRLVAESVARGVPGRAGAALRRIYLVATVGSVVVGGAIWLGGGQWVSLHIFDDPRMATVTGLSALWVAALAYRSPLAETFRGLHDQRMASYLTLAIPSATLALSLVVVWLLKIPMDLRLAVALSVGTAAGTLVLGLLLLIKKLPRLRGPGTIGMREILSISAPVFVINLGNMAINNGSLWIGGAFLEGKDIALYGAAMRLVHLVVVPMTLVVSVVQPVIAALNNAQDKPRLEHALRATATLSALPALAVLLVFGVFGPQVLGLVYGSQYTDAYLVLLILVVGQVFFVWAGPCNNVLTMTGHQRPAMVLTLTNGVLTAVMCVVMVKYAGLLGLAIAVTVGDIAKNLQSWLMARRLTGIWTHAMLSPTELKSTVVQLLQSVRERRALKGKSADSNSTNGSASDDGDAL
ncbi:MAG: lipopolysaccharide biosynthesis protein [Panacagrimonas sp.]